MDKSTVVVLRLFSRLLRRGIFNRHFFLLLNRFWCLLFLLGVLLGRFLRLGRCSLLLRFFGRHFLGLFLLFFAGRLLLSLFCFFNGFHLALFPFLFFFNLLLVRRNQFVTVAVNVVTAVL